MGQSTMIIYTLLNHPKFLLAEIPSFQGQELYNPFPIIYTNQIVPNMSNFRIETWFLAGVYRKGETIIVFGQTNWFLNIHASTNPIVVLLSFKMNMMIVIILYVHKILRDIVLFDVYKILHPSTFFSIVHPYFSHPLQKPSNIHSQCWAHQECSRLAAAGLCRAHHVPAWRDGGMEEPMAGNPKAGNPKDWRIWINIYIYM